MCVGCRRHPVDPTWRPFCSERCQLQDLARWADEAYRVPGDNDDDNDQADKTTSELDDDGEPED
jgi:uncharacterized protein